MDTEARQEFINPGSENKENLTGAETEQSKQEREEKRPCTRVSELYHSLVKWPWTRHIAHYASASPSGKQEL